MGEAAAGLLKVVEIKERLEGRCFLILDVHTLVGRKGLPCEM